MPRVKFTLTKLQEDVSENGAETNCSASEIISTGKIKNKTLHTSDPRRPGKQKTKGQAKAFQIKTLGCRLTAHFKNFRKTSTFSLKDERVLLLSHTLQAA